MTDILLHHDLFARLEDRIRVHQDRLRPLVLTSPEKCVAAWGAPLIGEPNPHAAFAHTQIFHTPEFPRFYDTLMSATALDWYQSPGAGFDHPMMVALGLKVPHFAACHEMAHLISEWCLWQALDHLRIGPTLRQQEQDATWKKLPARELAGSKWLIYGFGRIGWETARRVRALGASVTGVRRRAEAHEHADMIISPDQVSEHIGSADFVLLSAPLNTQTRGVANKDFFARMKEGALLLNVSRGQLLVETDLLAGIENGRPARAALDVFDIEPLPETSPLWAHPGISVTPHISGESPATIARVDEHFLRNLDRYVNGKPLLEIVPRSEFETLAQGMEA